MSFARTIRRADSLSEKRPTDQLFGRDPMHARSLLLALVVIVFGSGTLSPGLQAQAVLRSSSRAVEEPQMPPCALSSREVVLGRDDEDYAGSLAVGEGFCFVAVPQQTNGFVEVYQDVNGAYALVQTIPALPGESRFGLRMQFHEGRLFIEDLGGGLSVYAPNGPAGSWVRVRELPCPRSWDADGTRVAIQTDWFHVEVRERDFGGPDAWGVASTITAPLLPLSPTPKQAYFTWGIFLRGDLLLANVSDTSINPFTEIWPIVFDRNLGGANAWGVEFPVPLDKPSLLFATLGTDRLFLQDFIWMTGQGRNSFRVLGRDVGGPSQWGATTRLPILGQDVGNRMEARHGWGIRVEAAGYFQPAPAFALYSESESPSGEPGLAFRGVQAVSCCSIVSSALGDRQAAVAVRTSSLTVDVHVFDWQGCEQ